MDKPCLIVRRHPAIQRGYDIGDTIEVAGRKVIDLTSTRFNWFQETDEFTIINKSILDQYINNILDHVKDNCVLVISSHSVVEQMLLEMNQETIIAYPNPTKQREFLAELQKYPSAEEDLLWLKHNWNGFTDRVNSDYANKGHIMSNKADLTLIDLLEEYLSM